MKAWVTLRRTEGDPEAGEYVQVLRKQLHGDEILCLWRCLNCKTLLSIGRKYHSVNYLGELHPMVTCPKQCGFTHWVILDDWRPEAVGQA